MNYGFTPNPYNTQYIQNLQNLQRETEQRIQQAMNPPMNPMQQPAINQTFQLANSNNTMDFDAKYAKDINEVKNTFVIKTGLFINSDLTTLWLKDVSGSVRTFTLSEVIELDEKDKEILALRQQIDEMKEMINYGKSRTTNADEPNTSKKSTRVSNNKSNDA